MVEFTVFKGSKDGKLVKSSSKKEIGPNDVLVKVTHSGLCGTDLHYKNADIAIGHEGVGYVEEVGANVTRFKKGDRAGWGYMHWNCGDCKLCLTGRETYCEGRGMYGITNLDQGSLASHGIWRQDWLFQLPSELSLEDAAPLMCGGATVFTVFHSYNIKSTDRVAIMGVGGLGHLAIQYAAKMGCEVIVFSGTDSKKEEALQLGAREFYALKGATDLTKVVKNKIDHLLVTSSAQPDWNLFIPIMSPCGTIFPLGVSSDDFRAPYLPLLQQGLTVQGTIVATREVHREMLRFSAIHNIKPIIQKFPMTGEGINAALEKLESGKIRYRAVLEAAS